MVFCTCEDWKQLHTRNATVFKWHSFYGWLISWKELTDKISYTQVNNYGIKINYCPMCGNKLAEPVEEERG